MWTGAPLNGACATCFTKESKRKRSVDPATRTASESSPDCLRVPCLISAWWGCPGELPGTCKNPTQKTRTTTNNAYFVLFEWKATGNLRCLCLLGRFSDRRFGVHGNVHKDIVLFRPSPTRSGNLIRLFSSIPANLRVSVVVSSLLVIPAFGPGYNSLFNMDVNKFRSSIESFYTETIQNRKITDRYWTSSCQKIVLVP